MLSNITLKMLARKSKLISCFNSGQSIYLNYKRCFSTPFDQKKKYISNLEWNLAKPFSEIPGPSAIQLLARFLPGGKYHNLTLVQVQSKLRDEYGLLVRFPGTFGRKDVVYAFDPQDIEMVYRTEGIWPERSGLATLDYYREWMRPDIFTHTNGLMCDQGLAWSSLRKRVNSVMLKPEVARSYIPQVDAVACEFIDLIAAKRDDKNELSASFGQELNKWAVESVGVIALDQRLGVLNENNPEAKLVIRGVREFFQLTYELDVLPSIWKYVRTPKFKRLMRVFDDLTNLVLKYIDTRIADLGKAKSHQSCSVLEKILKIDRASAVVMVMDMLFAGVDTTSATAVGILYHLAKNPEKQEKLRQEIRLLLPEKNSKLTETSLNTIPYMRACIKESMRISPIVTGASRRAGQNIVLKGYQIPKGMDLALTGVLLQQEDEHFPNSSKFLPERWLRDQTKAEGCPSARIAHPYVFLPFGAGPRSCIGRRFAEMEIQILLMRILRQFHVEWHHPPIKYMTSIVLTPIGDLKFKFTELKD